MNTPNTLSDKHYSIVEIRSLSGNTIKYKICDFHNALFAYIGNLDELNVKDIRWGKSKLSRKQYMTKIDGAVITKTIIIDTDSLDKYYLQENFPEYFI